MSTIALTQRPSVLRPSVAGRVTAAFSDTADVAGRNLRALSRTPQALIFAIVQPVIFVLLFRYAFGGAIHVPGVDYVDYLMPGIFAQAVCFGAIGTAVGLSADLRSGILVRFRTLPMARIAVLGGRTLADLARNLVVVAVMIGVGFAAGFRSANGARPVRRPRPVSRSRTISSASALGLGSAPAARGGRALFFSCLPLLFRAAQFHARLAAGHRRSPAGQRPGHRRTGADPGRARRA